VFFNALTSASYWFCLLICVFIAIIPDLVLRVVEHLKKNLDVSGEFNLRAIMSKATIEPNVPKNYRVYWSELLNFFSKMVSKKGKRQFKRKETSFDFVYF